MSKSQQLMEYITQDIITLIVEDTNMEYDKAMERFYNSAVFEKLHDDETCLYLEGTAYVYDLFQNEIRNGRLIQEEV